MSVCLYLSAACRCDYHLEHHITTIKHPKLSDISDIFCFLMQVTNQTTTSNSSVENSHKQALTPLRKRGTPKNRFVYVKIEKTGSSTFSNIFSSFGYRHRLNMMMSTIPGTQASTVQMQLISSLVMRSLFDLTNKTNNGRLTRLVLQWGL